MPETKLGTSVSREEVAAAIVAGDQPPQLAKKFDVHSQTARRWMRDPDIKGLVVKGQREQGVQMRRQVYAAISKRLEKPAEIDLDTLLKLDKQLPPLPDEEVASESDFIKRLYLLADKYPAVAEALKIMVEVEGLIPANFSLEDDDEEETDDVDAEPES